MSYTKGQILTYNYTGDVKQLVIQGIKKIKIQCYGAGGQNGSQTYKGGGSPTYAYGHNGDYAEGELDVNEGDILYIYAGGTNGYNGGSLSTSTSTNSEYSCVNGGSGGASEIRLNATDPSCRIISATGGAGAHMLYGVATPICTIKTSISGVLNGIINGSGSSNLTNGKIVITIEEVNNNKYLIKQDNKYYSVKDNTLTLLGIPTDDTQKEQWFNDYGVDDLKEALLTPREGGSKLIDSLDNQFEVRMMVLKG